MGIWVEHQSYLSAPSWENEQLLLENVSGTYSCPQERALGKKRAKLRIQTPKGTVTCPEPPNKTLSGFQLYPLVLTVLVFARGFLLKVPATLFQELFMAVGRCSPCHLTQGKQLRWSYLRHQNQPLKMVEGDDEYIPQVPLSSNGTILRYVLYSLLMFPEGPSHICPHLFNQASYTVSFSCLCHVSTLLASWD